MVMESQWRQGYLGDVIDSIVAGVSVNSGKNDSFCKKGEKSGGNPSVCLYVEYGWPGSDRPLSGKVRFVNFE